jgi:hypothetical protein
LTPPNLSYGSIKTNQIKKRPNTIANGHKLLSRMQIKPPTKTKVNMTPATFVALLCRSLSVIFLDLLFIRLIPTFVQSPYYIKKRPNGQSEDIKRDTISSLEGLVLIPYQQEGRE